MKKRLCTLLACIYLSGLWVYQLPISQTERVLTKIFSPIQGLTLTNRQYRMYAPGPRSQKNLPFIFLKTSSSVRFLKGPTGLFTEERWSNFIYDLSKTLDREIFQRFALDVCRRESNATEPVQMVSLQTRLVDFSDFRGDIAWSQPEVLETFLCR